MRANEFMDEIPLLEMAYSRKLAHQIFMGLQSSINDHLICLLGLNSPDETRQHWKKEIVGWLDKLSLIVIKPSNKPVPEETVFKWLYDEPFGGVEIKNVTAILAYLERRKGIPRNQDSIAGIAAKLRIIHLLLAKEISQNKSGEHLIDAL